MTDFHLDYETRSVLSLDQYGLDRYIKHPSTQVLLASYAEGDHKPKLWQPHLDPKMPGELREALEDPWIFIHAWNSTFERAISKFVLHIDKPIQEFRDPMVMARSLSLPGTLEEAGAILGLREDLAKIKDGKRLIKLFCEPEDEGGEETLFGLSLPTFRDWRTDPQDWQRFCDYCCQDVVAERAAEKKMSKFPVPETEWETWYMDQAINEIGWPVDRPTVDGAKFIAEKEREPLVARLKTLTGLGNPNSRSQVLPWLQERGYSFGSLGKAFVARAVGGESDLTDEAKEVLEIRNQTSKSSVSKYTLLSDLTEEDGRLRYQYTFYGAHSGRWAAHGANLGNLPKPTKDVEKNLDLAVDLVRKMDYDAIVEKFGKPLEVASSVLRSSFRAPAGYKFVVADLNAIENRGLGYLARCDSILQVFRDGRDPYLDFATKMYGDSYESLEAEYLAGDKTKRTICKAPVLGAGYALGAGKEDHDEQGNLVLTGLRGYAAKMGVEMDQEQARFAIQVFRESYPEVVWLWKDMERASAFAIRHPGQVIGVGVPQTKWEQENFEKLGRKILDPIVSFKCTGTKVLEMLLPSGRSLFFMDPRVEEQEKEWKGRKYKQDVVFHKSRDQKTKQWVELPNGTFGGRWVENCDQAVSRDVLVYGMKNAITAGFQVVGHTYDELITLVSISSGLGVKELCDCMTAPPDWCGDSFPLGAAGFEDIIYRKD
jgi:DNA polymerase